MYFFIIHICKNLSKIYLVFLAEEPAVRMMYGSMILQCALEKSQSCEDDGWLSDIAEKQ